MRSLILATNALEAFSLHDKVALITGASSGIGAQQARALGAAGAHLVLVARSEDSLKSLQVELAAKDIKASYIAADLLDEQQWDSVVEQAQSCYGRIDILCNTAGG